MDEESKGNIIDFVKAKERRNAQNVQPKEEYPLGIKAFKDLSQDAVNGLEKYCLQADTQEKRHMLQLFLGYTETFIDAGQPDILDLDIFDLKRYPEIGLPPMDVQMEFRALAFRQMAVRNPRRGEFAKLEAAKLMDQAEEVRRKGISSF